MTDITVQIRNIRLLLNTAERQMAEAERLVGSANQHVVALEHDIQKEMREDEDEQR